MRVEVAKVGEIAAGGMKFVKVGDAEIVLCNCEGRYYAIDRRCGHMNGPLELGNLDGTIVTCPMHHVQFDVTNGQALNNPIPEFISEPLSGKWAQTMRHIGALMDRTSVCNVHTFGVIVEGDAIQVEVA